MDKKLNYNDGSDPEGSRIKSELEKSMQEFLDYCGIEKEDFDKGVEKQKRLRTYRRYQTIADGFKDFISGELIDTPEGYILIKKTDANGRITCISIEDMFPSIMVEWTKTNGPEEMTRGNWEFDTSRLPQSEIVKRVIGSITEIQKHK